MGPTDRDLVLLRQALALAEQAIGRSDPNPRVGCVIAGQGWTAQGCTQAAGGAHAEIVALRAARDAGHDPRGAHDLSERYGHEVFERLRLFDDANPTLEGLRDLHMLRALRLERMKTTPLLERGGNVGVGTDHTLFALVTGQVSFQTKREGRCYVSILPMAAAE